MFTSRKMFPRLNGHSHSYNQNQSNGSNNNNPTSYNVNPYPTATGSWRTFSRKSYFSKDTTDTRVADGGNLGARPSDETKTLNKIWIYTGIAFVYLLIIGIVVTVLVLAPRYPSYYYYPPPPAITLPVPLNEQPALVETEDIAIKDIDREFVPPEGKPFLPSQRDPVLIDQGMDPRSDLVFNETSEEKVIEQRINDRFLMK